MMKGILAIRARVARAGQKVIKGGIRQVRNARSAASDPMNVPRFAGGFMSGLAKEWRWIAFGLLLGMNFTLTSLLVLAFVREHGTVPSGEMAALARGLGTIIKSIIVLTLLIGIKSGWQRGYDAVELPGTPDGEHT